MSTAEVVVEPLKTAYRDHRSAEHRGSTRQANFRTPVDDDTRLLEIDRRQ